MIQANTYKMFSIITVTYNCATTVARTIESVLCQGKSLYEYIVIDGASTDGTKEIIENYKENIDYFISEPDNGIYNAMNKALDIASGDMILFLNGDDYFADDAVLDRVLGEYTDDQTIIIGRIMFGDKPSKNMSNVKTKSKYYGVLYPHQSTFVPKRIYDNIGGFDEKYPVASDFEFICRAMYKGYKIKWIDEVVSYYSLGGKSSTLQGRIDEYLISTKYMSLTHDEYIEDMKTTMIDYMTNSLFEILCVDDSRVEKCKNIFDEIHIGRNGAVQIWGAGYWGELLYQLLKKCKISVNYVFDSNKQGELFVDTPIVTFDKDVASMIIISTEKYDEEVGCFLRDQGYVEGIDFYGFHHLEELLLKAFDKSSEVYQILLKQTGLDIIS